MILPEDTKLPIEEDYESRRFHPNYDYTLPPSDDSGDLYYPLLVAREDDIELGPAPPYSANDSRDDIRVWRNTKPQRAIPIKRAVAWVCFTIFLAIFYIFLPGPRSFPHRRGHHRWYQTESTFDEADDGTKIDCAQFTLDGWRNFPSQAHKTNGSYVEDQHVRLSTNTSFVLPITDHEVLFTRLAGVAAVGDFFLDTYDPAMTPSESKTPDQAPQTAASYTHDPGLRITVEPIITLQSDENHLQESIGWRLLQAADICLMKRRAGPGKRERPSPFPASGVGVYTHEIDDPTQTPRDSALQFRVHLSLPITEPQTARSKSFFDTLLGDRTAMTKSYIPGLSVYGGVGDIRLSDLNNAAIGQLELSSRIGNISIDGIKADALRLETQTGEIRGRVAISSKLDTNTPSGDIRLNVTLAQSAENASPMPFHKKMSRNVFGQRPYSVNAGSGTGDIYIRYLGWEDLGRILAQDIHSLVGSVEVHSHPMFQGPFYASSDLGSVDVHIPSESVSDPTGQGRARNITLDKHGGLGSTLHTGKVEWLDLALTASAHVKSSDPHGEADAPPFVPRPGLNIKASVGNIHLFL